MQDGKKKGIWRSRKTTDLKSKETRYLVHSLLTMTIDENTVMG